MAAFATSTSISVTAKPATPTVSSVRPPCMVAGKTIGETIAADPNYSTLSSLLKATSIDIDAAGGGTLFAPPNRAFSGLSEGYLDEICADPIAAKTLLLRHLLPETVTVADMKKSGSGKFESVPGGPLPYDAAGVVNIKVGGASVDRYAEEDVCDNGVIHKMNDVITDLPRTIFDPLSVETKGPVQTAKAPEVISISIQSAQDEKRSRNAAKMVSTVGGRNAMGLMKQLPFWMYGPPFNAGKQEDYEPISIAEPSLGTGVDYQLMPPGSVVVVPDEVDAAKLNPVSGMSKYIGKTKKLVEGDGLSDYSKLDNL